MQKIQINIATQWNTNPPTDMTPLEIAALSYTLYIDTVNPPVKSYPVPAANVKAAVGNVVSILPSDIGFVPAAGVTYYLDASEASGAAVSPLSAVFKFTEPKVPLAPTVVAS